MSRHKPNGGFFIYVHKSIVFSLGLIVAGSGLAFAAPHPATYTKRIGTLGVTFEANGRTYKLVKVPFKAFEGGKYAIVFPVQVLENDLGSGRRWLHSVGICRRTQRVTSRRSQKSVKV